MTGVVLSLPGTLAGRLEFAFLCERQQTSIPEHARAEHNDFIFAYKVTLLNRVSLDRNSLFVHRQNQFFSFHFSL